MTAQLPHPITAPIPRYHAKTEYSVPSDQADAIIRVSAYHRKDFDCAVIWFETREHRRFLSSAFREPKTSLGELDRLPLELINEICLQLDIASLFSLRQTNARARHVLNALHEYQIVTTHALNAFCALLRTHSASRVTLLDFYRLLCTQNCSLCNDQYGDLVYLPTWIRCCSHCLRKGVSGLRVVTLACVKRVLDLSKNSLAQLSALTTLRGIYTMDKRPRSSQMIRMTIVPTQSALSAYSEENGETRPAQSTINRLRAQSVLMFMACCALPSYNPQTRQIENGISCAGCQLALQDGITTSRAEWTCDVRDMVYSRDGFLKHFVWCEQAQVLWLGSKTGTVKPSTYPYSCKRGGFFGRTMKPSSHST